MKRLMTITLAAILVLQSLWVFADPASEFRTLFGGRTQFKSVHTHTEIRGSVMDSDFVAPDRYRIMTSRGTGEIIIGNKLWMHRNGTWKPMPPQMGAMVKSIVAQARQTIAIREYVDMTTIRSAGMRTVNGKPARGYSYKLKNNLGSGTIWVDSRGYPLEVDGQSSYGASKTVYSKINERITINEP